MKLKRFFLVELSYNILNKKNFFFLNQLFILLRLLFAAVILVYGKKNGEKKLNQFLFFQVHKQAYHINLMKDGMKVKIKHVKR